MQHFRKLTVPFLLVDDLLVAVHKITTPILFNSAIKRAANLHHHNPFIVV